MDVESLKFNLGTTLQLQAVTPANAPRFMVKLIGYQTGGSMIVTAPTSGGKVQIVREGQPFNVRMLQGDSVVGFVAKALKSQMNPYPYMHLEYPKDFEQITVRNSVRVNVQLGATVRNTRNPDSPEQFHKVNIIDLSESGAKLASGIPLGDSGDMLQINFELSVLGQAETMTLVADLKNVNQRLEKDEQVKRLEHIYGVQFRAVNRFQQVLLHAWVMGQMAVNS